ncbi:hypothetical protein MTR_1g041595 [Medicago truncatula]|uniref:Uncharacterized protein n=1 Tax=Medicago truncatula TaxID=3880 RepID=A0A072VI15_MEDTR|nr:hypothetical protein MTR_1g041595 [Medicago truncatula]
MGKWGPGMQHNACSSYSVSNAINVFTYAKGESAQQKQRTNHNIKDRDPSDLDLKINIAGAFGVPSLCKATDDFSQCSLTEDDKLMEYDALLLDWFFDSYYPGFTGDDP